MKGILLEESEKKCKGCGRKLIFVITPKKAQLNIYPKEKLNYCEDCWKRILVK